MKRARIEDIEAAREQRKPGFVEECFKRGRKIRDGLWLEFEDIDHAYIRQLYRLDQPTNPKSPHKFPSAFRVARNAAGAAGRVIASATTGKPIQASEETFQARIKICAACEFFDKTSQRCSQCGCFMGTLIIGKARLEAEKCPKNRWPIVPKDRN